MVLVALKSRGGASDTLGGGRVCHYLCRVQRQNTFSFNQLRPLWRSRAELLEVRGHRQVPQVQRRAGPNVRMQ